MATLHRLLWGACDGADQLGEWPLRPWETPAVGLPVRVATGLFLLASRRDVPDEWRPRKGPVVWMMEDDSEVLANGRREQFGHIEINGFKQEMTAGDPGKTVRVMRTEEWEVIPHASYFMPFRTCQEPDRIDWDSYVLYCDALLLLTAIDGGEAVLDNIMKKGRGILPFQDRWAWRSRIHLPREAWPLIDAIIRWTEEPEQDCTKHKQRLLTELEHYRKSKTITKDDFDVERIDIQLDPGDKETVRSVRSLEASNVELPEELVLSGSTLADQLRVRIGQLSQWLEKTEIVDELPRWKPTEAHKVMEQVATVCYSPSGTGLGRADDDVQPDIIVLPEVAIPQSEVQTLRNTVKTTGYGVLAGLYWRALRPVYPGIDGNVGTRRWIVNEAELAVPVGYEERGPTLVRWYRVRKPIPAHVERGLADALSRPGQRWAMLPGRTWYRFVHSRWGDFTIAVCADLLDGSPWHSLRGEILHLFMVAYNPDVALYESLTWTRAYENYVNLVGVNHGSHGGSFLWTPRRRHGRELARLRGQSLLLSADVTLPTRELLDEQKNGVRRAVKREACRWREGGQETGKYKSPPPGYRRGAAM